MLIDKNIDVGKGFYSSIYEFDAVGPGKCGPNSTCEGWSMGGNYSISTNA